MLTLIPKVAFAFMDAPTVTVTFPSYLIIVIPMIAYEIAYISGKIHAPKSKTLKACFLTHLLTFIIMIVGGWFLTYIRENVIHIIDLRTFGITFLHDPPSALGIIFSLSVGSAVLIQEAAYRWLNLIVIISFLLPTFMLSTFLGIRIFNHVLTYADKTRLKSILFLAKSLEYGFLIVASVIYLNVFYEL